MRNSSKRRTQSGDNPTSRFKGVHFKRDKNKWAAKIVVNKQVHHLGYFASEEDAAAAYNSAAIEFFDTFASDGL